MSRLLQVFIALACVTLVSAQVTPSPTPSPTPTPSNCSVGSGNYHYPSFDGSYSSVSGNLMTFAVAFPNAAQKVEYGFVNSAGVRISNTVCNYVAEFRDRPDPWAEVLPYCDATIIVEANMSNAAVCGFQSVIDSTGTGSKGFFKLILTERTAVIRGITINRTMEYAVAVRVNYAQQVVANTSAVGVYGAASAQVVVTGVQFDSNTYAGNISLTSSVQSPYVFTAVSYDGPNPNNGYTLTPGGSLNGNCSSSVSGSCVQSWSLGLSTTTGCSAGGPSSLDNDWIVTLTAACDVTKINCTGVPSPLKVNVTFRTSSPGFCASIVGAVSPTLTLTSYSGDNLIPQTAFVWGAKSYFRAVLDSPVSVDKIKLTEVSISSGAASSVTGPLYTHTYDGSSPTTIAAFMEGIGGGITAAFAQNKFAIDSANIAASTSPFIYFWIIFDSSNSAASGDNPIDTTVFVRARIKYTGATGSAERDVRLMFAKNKQGQFEQLADSDSTPASMGSSAQFSVVRGTTTPTNTASSTATTSNLAVIAVASVGGAIAILSVAAIVAIRKRRQNAEQKQGSSSINLMTSLETPAATA